MISDTVRTLFLRDLRALRREIEAYSDERLLWETRGGITNSAGNLALHLCGNLQHFIGARLGNTGYVRDSSNRRCSADSIRGGAVSPRRRAAVRRSRDASHVVRPACP